MSFEDVLRTRLTEQFNEAKVIGTHDLAPRNGYFFIEAVDYENIKGTKVPIATTLWKAKANDTFIKNIHFRIALSSLNLGNSLDYITLFNKVIQISNARIVQEAIDIKPKVNFEYLIDDTKPSFVTFQEILLAAFMGDETITLFEAYQKFESDSGLDLSESHEEEARGQDITEDFEDEIIEDPIDNIPYED